MVDQTARRRHQDIQAAQQRLILRAVFDTTVNGRDLQAHALGIGLEAFGDLRRQFARRRQDQRAHGARRRHLAVRQDVLEDRQSKGRRLAGAGLGNAQQVVALQQEGNGLGLDGRGDGIAFALQRQQEGGRQAQISKGSRKGLGHVTCFQNEGHETGQAETARQTVRARTCDITRSGGNEASACTDFEGFRQAAPKTRSCLKAGGMYSVTSIPHAASGAPNRARNIYFADAKAVI